MHQTTSVGLGLLPLHTFMVMIACLLLVPAIYGQSSAMFGSSGETDRLDDVTAISLNTPGPHVCSRMESYSMNITVSESRKFTQIYYVPCTKFLAWFQCTKSRDLYRLSYRAELKTAYRPIKVCCEPYLQQGEMCLRASGVSATSGSQPQGTSTRLLLFTSAIISILPTVSIFGGLV